MDMIYGIRFACNCRQGYKCEIWKNVYQLGDEIIGNASLQKMRCPGASLTPGHPIPPRRDGLALMFDQHQTSG